MMRCLVCIAVLAAFVGAQENQTETSNSTSAPQSGPEMPYLGFNPFLSQNGNADSVLASFQMQNHYSQLYGKFILDFQSAQGWLQVAQGWVALAHQDSDLAKAPFGLFEENGDDEKDLEEGGDNTKDLERQTELALMYVLKLWYLQAAQKLNDAKVSNYQNKMILSYIAQSGAQVPPTILTLGYYLEALRVWSSAISIQRQDAWNNWNLHELMETDEFRGDMPDDFESAMAHSRATSMQLYYTDASLDLQIYMMDYYIQSLIMQAVPGIPRSSSFLEVEETAEPSKPFIPMMVGGMMGPQYLHMFSMYMKYFSLFMNVQAAQGLYTHAMMVLKPSDDSDQFAKPILMQATTALQQWAYLKFQLAVIQIYGLFMGTQMPTANAVNSNASA